MEVAIPALLVALDALVAWLFAFGLTRAWDTIMAAIKRSWHDKTSWLTYVALAPGLIVDIVAKKVHGGRKTLGSEGLAAEPTMAGFIGSMGAVLQYHAFTTKYIARDMLHAMNVLAGHTIPAATGARVKTTRELAESALARARQADRLAAAALAAGIAALKLWGKAAHHAEVTAQKALAKTGAIAIPRPGEVARERAQDKALSEESAVTRWLRKLAVGAAGLTFAGLVIRALTKELPWFKCSNVNRAMRQVCRTPYHFLSDLLALGADFFVLSNICRVIPWLEAAYADVAAPLVSKLTEVASRVCAPPAGKPAHYDVPALHLPPVTFTQLYLP